MVGKRGLKLIETNKLEELIDKIKTNEKIRENLSKKVDQLEKEKMKVEENLALTKLENRAENLKVEISLLIEVKKELEGMIKYLEDAPLIASLQKDHIKQ